MSSQTTSRRLSVNMAAEYCGCSVSWLNKLRLTQAGPVYIKLGSKVVYDEADLAAWLDAQKRTSTSEQGAQA